MRFANRCRNHLLRECRGSLHRSGGLLGGADPKEKKKKKKKKHTLRDIYYAEQQIAENLPDMIEKATDQKLKSGFETHLAETKGQIVRLKVFKCTESK